MSKHKSTPGIEVRHTKVCPAAESGAENARCRCSPSYRAAIFDKGTGRKIKRTFPTVGAAKRWRQDAIVALRNGKLDDARRTPTVREACDEWAAAARAGVVTTRSGDHYKPAAIRAYEQSLRLRVLDRIGDAQVHTVRRVHLQALVDDLVADGHAPATVVGAITPLRVVFSRARQNEEIEVLPTAGVKLPAVRTRRERFATREEAKALVAAEADRAIWATAVYSGLRRGELMALKWDAVDLKAGTIEVRASWDVEFGPQETKNRTRRRVPICAVLRESLTMHRLRQAPNVPLVFGESSHRPFSPTRLAERADGAWEAAGLKRITLHECRHSYASISIAAGLNAKSLCDYMGHASILTTFDRYGHLMPGSHNEAASLLDAYLDGSQDEAVG